MFLLSFLRARKFDKEKAIKLLRNYYSTRKKFPNIFGEFNPSAVKKYLDMKMIGYLPHTDQDGSVLGIGRCPCWDPSKVHVSEVVKCFIMFLDMAITGHIIQVNGIVIILDAEKLSWRHVLQLTPSTLFCIVSIVFQSIPVSYKAIHVINIGPLVYAFYTAFRPFLPYKIKKRLHFHSSGIESLHKFISPQHLPVEYGGQLPPLDVTECNESIMKFQEYFEDNQKYFS
ncbi:alpha-tocopherol transfer protein-like [Centruroides vittatus]|uniref:alpha-tocopherol transfer protein-like n=1 Tax=Centruroides vittatus TaxID=120091 RepID=UPI003510A14A